VRLACVVHRFGADIAGGSEAHCRQVAERLAAAHDVTILTTCARDHVTWRNEYAAGATTHGALRVLRFPVARERSLHRFQDASDIAFSRTASEAEQEAWFRENGPDAPALLEYLRTEGHRFDFVLFWAFRYAEVYFGLPSVADRAILVPTAEDDAVVRMPVLERFFGYPAGYLFLTPEEQTLVERRHPSPLPPSAIIGSGLEPVGTPATADIDALGVRRPFLLYLGRVDPNKGCGLLLQHFTRYKREHDRAVQLVMAGPANMPIPDHPDVVRLGFVSDPVRETLLAQAASLVVPSRYESLSLVLLEGWNHGLGALVNGHCAVLEGQVSRADAGLYFRNYDEFAHAVEYLLEHPDVARQLGRQGLEYVDRHYRWPLVIARIEQLLASVGERSGASRD
jgi:glycosyltransferase involved in cell wall biosynthesis